MDSLSKYHKYVRENPKTISSMEEGLRMASLMLPTSRFGDKAELVTEVSYAVLGLIGFYHDKVIDQRSGELSGSVPELVRTTLGLLTNTEIVIEMGTRHYSGHSRRWQVIQVIETLKVIMRLYLLMQLEQGKILENGGVPDSKKVRQVGEKKEPETASEPAQRQQEWVGKRSGKSLRLTGTSQRYAQVRPKAPTTSQSEVGSDALLGLIGEVLHIVRPLLYVILTRTQRNRRSWTPWVASLVVDLVSARCSMVAASSTGTDDGSSALQRFLYGPGIGTSSKETKKELQRRKVLFAYYLMRNPVFDLFTAKLVKKIFSPLEKIAMLKNMSQMPSETLRYYHENHFYSSAS